MKRNEIKVGETYMAKVSGRIVKVRVLDIRSTTRFDRVVTVYDVLNLTTNKRLTFKSAQRFRNSIYNQVTRAERHAPADIDDIRASERFF